MKESTSLSSSDATPLSVFHPTHKRMLTPTLEPEPEPLYQLLKVRVALGTLKTSHLSLLTEKCSLGDNKIQVLSSSMFGPSLSHGCSKGSMEDFFGGSLTLVFEHIHDQECKRSSLVPVDFRGSRGSQTSELADDFSLPIACEMRKNLGMSGMMGGSDVSCYQGPDLDALDPDSDVPDELRFILATHSGRNSVAKSLSFLDDQDETVSKPLPGWFLVLWLKLCPLLRVLLQHCNCLLPCFAH